MSTKLPTELKPLGSVRFDTLQDGTIGVVVPEMGFTDQATVIRDAIVHRYNSHGDLLAACNAALIQLPTNPVMARMKLEAAIAKATGARQGTTAAQHNAFPKGRWS